MCCFMLIFHLFRNVSLTLKRQYLGEYRVENRVLSKSKLILCEWNAFYFSEIAFIDFTLHEIKQCIVFLGNPVFYRAHFSLTFLPGTFQFDLFTGYISI